MPFINDSKNLSHSDSFSSPNQYVMLLQRLDEEEGLSEPSIEEKLKLAEDGLRLSCAKFCEAASTLLDNQSTDGAPSQPNVVDPETVQELFEVKCFKPSLRPPKTKLRTLSTERDELSRMKPAIRETKRGDRLSKRKFQQAYYLPPATWFASEKPSTDLSSEEVELLSSCATKAFVRYLEDKKREIPKIFSIPQANQRENK